jgi:hypothetical protein
MFDNLESSGARYRSLLVGGGRDGFLLNGLEPETEEFASPLYRA